MVRAVSGSRLSFASRLHHLLKSGPPFLFLSPPVAVCQAHVQCTPHGKSDKDNTVYRLKLVAGGRLGLVQNKTDDEKGTQQQKKLSRH